VAELLFAAADVTPSKEFMDKIQAEQDAARQAMLEATRLEEEAARLHAEMTQVCCTPHTSGSPAAARTGQAGAEINGCCVRLAHAVLLCHA
jgi:hypothetical protein